MKNTSAIEAALKSVRDKAEHAALEKLAPEGGGSGHPAYELRTAVSIMVEDERQRWDDGNVPEEWYDRYQVTGLLFVAYHILNAGDEAVAKASEKLAEKLQELIA